MNPRPASVWTKIRDERPTYWNSSVIRETWNQRNLNFTLKTQGGDISTVLRISITYILRFISQTVRELFTVNSNINSVSRQKFVVIITITVVKTVTITILYGNSINIERSLFVLKKVNYICEFYICEFLTNVTTSY